MKRVPGTKRTTRASRAFAAALLALSALLCVRVARAIPVPSLDVQELEKGSDVLAVGELASAREIERGTYKLRGFDVEARLMEATLRASRVLKGAAAQEYKVRYYETQALIGYDYAAEGRRGLFFLKRGGEAYSFASPYHVSISASSGECESSGPPLARVAAEMACLLRAETGKKRPRVEAIEALATIRNEAATEALREAARTQPEPLNFLAADKLLARGDISQLPLAETALAKSDEIDIEEEGFRMSGGWNSIEEISDKRAVPSLVRISRSSDARVRRSALRALANTKDPSAIPAMLEALDDSDAGVRWYAVMSLAEMAGEDGEGGKWYPDEKTFESDEGLYVAHWKAWALGKIGRPGK